jgi:hypothetical protein
VSELNIDYAQLAAWRAHRAAQQQVCQWKVLIIWQVQKNKHQLQDVLVTAVSAEDAQSIALSRYLKAYPRRASSTWVQSVEKVA